MASSQTTDQPEAYKQGSIDFYNLPFSVTSDVLIPRPETEMIIEAVKKLASTSPSDKVEIIDVGTGSGILAVTLAILLPKARITAIDISNKALTVAKKNALTHQVTKKIKFMQNDLLSRIKVSPDIIVTNLPYIPSSRIKELDNSVKHFEPHLALDGGEDGFDLYRRLFSQIKEQGIEPSYLFAEIDDDQGKVALAEVARLFPTAQASIKQDFANLDRLLTIRFI